MGIRYRTVESWRGVACLGVLLFHSFGSTFSSVLWRPLVPLRAAGAQGWLGLHLFFVISGYCIFERLHASAERGESVSRFWFDRALRILPVYWAALALTLALNLLASPFNHVPFARDFPNTCGDWLGDLTLLHLLLGRPATVLVSWTLSCELTFYFIAGVLYLTGRGARRLWPAFVFGGLLCLPAVHPAQGRWAVPLMLWPQFYLGGCLSFALRGRTAGRGWLSVSALAALVVISGAAVLGVGAFGGKAGMSAAAFAWMLMLLAPFDEAMMRLLPARALAAVGGFSYSLYLVHAPILSHAINLGRRWMPASSAAFGAWWCCSIGLTIAGSWVFWRGVEQPMERFRARFRRPRPQAVAAPCPAA